MKKKTLIIAALAMLMMPGKLLAQNFNDYFVDKTLRVDYTFVGNAKQQMIAVDELNVMPRWYGKKQRLGEVPVEGNGQITVRAHKTGEVIYRNSFSTLFQEWLSYPEAKKNTQSFENVFLVPMPKDTVDITLSLFNNRREVTASLTHQVVPTDILIHHKGEKPTAYETIQQAADTTRCIHVAYVAEGYTDAEMDTFIKDVKDANEALFNHEPFKKMRDRLAGTPYEHIIVLVNSKKYGGGGILNSYNLTSTHHKWYKPVVVHEFGHSFAGLADEYAYDFEEIPMYPHDVEPWEPNITTLVNFSSKWKDMVKKGTPIPTPLSENTKVAESKVGVFEGAGYSTKGVYRGVQDCRMRINDTPEFCPVCKRAITNLIDFYTK